MAAGKAKLHSQVGAGFVKILSVWTTGMNNSSFIYLSVKHGFGIPLVPKQ
jgi:hypothetical protein